ncbi:MAG: hypothetical protein ACOX4M_09335 [Acetivibrionales bacterium]|jgi:thymidine kinase
MIKVIYGPKGTGKTKTLVEAANEMARHAKGTVVFIDDSKQLIFSLDRKIRFVNVSDFPPMSGNVFFGFICGILSQNYDIEGIFIDRLNFVAKEKADGLETFFKNLEKLDKEVDVSFLITISGNIGEMPPFLKKYAE